MSYRSDIRIITSKKGFQELKKFTDNYLKEKNWEYGNLLDDCIMICENDNSKYFGWNSINWYEFSNNYKDVTAIMKGLEHLKEKDLSYRYARIGESYDDYEQMSNESDKESEQDLEYPCMIGKFDDEYAIEKMIENSNENRFNLNNIYVKNMLDYKLEDDESLTGGLSFSGETLKDFIENDFEENSNKSILLINNELKLCGIKTITEQDCQNYFSEKKKEEMEL